jgi:hypoxanthine phosphoribosyltransferase
MQFPSYTFSQDPMEYIAPTWSDMNLLAFEVARQVLDSNWRPDRIVTLAKGGWAMTRSLVDYLGVNDVASMGVKFYSGINERLDQPEIYQDLPVTIAGEKLLLFDDVAETGHSLVFARDILLERGAAEIKTATLFYKPHSVLKPDYFAAETSTWIVFQYECIEAARMLVPKWRASGAEESEIVDRLGKLGLDEQVYGHYLKLIAEKEAA